MKTKVCEVLSPYLAENETLPSCLYLYGQKSAGKTFCLHKFLEEHKSWLKSVVVDLSECYSSRILFETVINRLYDHRPSADNGYTSYGKVEAVEDFLLELSNLDPDKSFLVAIERAEKLRDMDINILPVFMKLQEFTGLNITCVFVSHLAWEKIDSTSNIIEVFVPDFTKTDIITILSSKYKDIHNKIIKSIEISDTSESEKNNQLEIAQKLDEDFYKGYLNTFLNVFYKASRDITELQYNSNKCYISYYTPVLRGEIKFNDVTNLWRNISKVLRSSLQNGYMRVGIAPVKEATEEFSIEPVKENSLRTFAQNLELPYYAKYLLIASFLASHNDAKYDKRLYMKYHGKERKRQQKAKVRTLLKSTSVINQKFLF